MKRFLKITFLSIFSIVAILFIALGGYVIYLKYLKQDIEPTYYYADKLKIDKDDFKSEFEEIHQEVMLKPS